MKAQKATGPMKTLLVALSVLSMLLTGLFVANSTQAGADPINCPDGFQLTEDEQSCFDHPVVVTRQGPVECEVGDLTPDKSACYTSVTFNTQSPTSTVETIDASVTANAPTITCPTGFTYDATRTAGARCVGTAAVADTVVPTIVSTNAPVLSCPSGGTLNGANCDVVTPGTVTAGTYVPAVAAVAGAAAVAPVCTGTDFTFNGTSVCKRVGSDALAVGGACPAGFTIGPVMVGNLMKCFQTAPVTPGTPAVAAVAARPATCNGVATTAAASACQTVTPASTSSYPAASAPVANTVTCPAGFAQKTATTCSVMNPDRATAVAETVTPNPSNSSCPAGYAGPSSNNMCTRTILTAQPDVPTCTSGTLLDIGNGFVCLLDNAPVAPAPISGPECPRGEYDAKADLCFVSSTTGTHPGSITVVAKDAASAGGALAPAFTG